VGGIIPCGNSKGKRHWKEPRSGYVKRGSYKAVYANFSHFLFRTCLPTLFREVNIYQVVPLSRLEDNPISLILRILK
jgi:hypothetical protein